MTVIPAGQSLQPDLLLQAHRVAYGAVLDCAKVGG